LTAAVGEFSISVLGLEVQLQLGLNLQGLSTCNVSDRGTFWRKHIFVQTRPGKLQLALARYVPTLALVADWLVANPQNSPHYSLTDCQVLAHSRRFPPEHFVVFSEKRAYRAVPLSLSLDFQLYVAPIGNEVTGRVVVYLREVYTFGISGEPFVHLRATTNTMHGRFATFAVAI
jgi:hypothetical protein